MTYDFSALKLLRKRKKMTLAALGRKAHVSSMVLSKIERNCGNPELKTLDRISRALGLATHNLLSLAERRRPTAAKEEVRTILNGASCRFVNLEGMRLLFVKGDKGHGGGDPELHENDHEYCFVLDGRMKVTVRGSEYEVGAGEGLFWDCMFEHECQLLEPTTFISVVAPKRP